VSLAVCVVIEELALNDADVDDDELPLTFTIVTEALLE
jgi:hypothetical protein